MASSEVKISEKTDTKKPEAQKPKPRTAERRFVARSVNAFVQWMPLGGSGFAFASFCLQQNWAQAVFMFPVMVVTGIWAAYSESFVTRIREIYAERGKQDADALVRWMDSLDQAIRWQLSGFEEKYLKCQASSCQDYRVEGFQPQGIFVPQLEEVFVPLRLSGDSLRHGPQGRQWRKKASKRTIRYVEDEILQIWDLLRKIEKIPAYKSMAILAWGGSGKTTLLRSITFAYANRKHGKYRAPKLVPVLLYLRIWRDEIAKETPPNLPELIEQHMRSLPDGKRLNPPPNWTERILRCGEALVMIDGFDEVAEAQREAVSRWISEQMREYHQSVFILTSRPGGYEHYSAEKPQTQLTVRGFNQEQRQKFIEQWYLCQEKYARAGRETSDVRQLVQQQSGELISQIEARPELQQMASNPLLLNMIATFHCSYPDIELPQQRGELYQEICKLQLGARPLAKRIQLLLSAEKAQLVLQTLALAMVQRKKPAMERAEVLEILRHKLGEMQLKVDAMELLQQFVNVSELLVAEKSAETLEFAHLSFQGYLAANEIKRLSQEALLLEHTADTWWHETTILYTAQLEQPSDFIRSFYKLGTSDAVRLAHVCWRETRYKTEPDLNLEIRQQWYQVLEQLLINHQWEEADQETCRLMATMTGPDEDEWFYPSALPDFPCEDLHRLDQLWASNSNGKYGFSVQKKIWEECGSPTDYNDDWEKFGDRLSWRMGETWVASFAQLNLNRMGVLPYGFHAAAFRQYLDRILLPISYLARRLVDCNPQGFQP